MMVLNITDDNVIVAVEALNSQTNSRWDPQPADSEDSDSGGNCRIGQLPH